MSKSILLSLLGAVALGSALLGGCGDSDKKPETAATGAQSGPGESCTKSADCTAGFVCFSGVCSMSAGNTDGGVPPVPLGAKGESCQRHADCASNLSCYNGICTDTPTADAGTMGPQLGRRGEACQSASDCQAGLTCVIVTTATSVCDLASFPPPSANNKMCSECSAPSDCCELPQTIEASDTLSSCADLDDKLKTALGTATCATTTDTAAQRLCFIQSSYCKCASTTWDCQNGQCIYTASCKATGLAKQGCATVSRTDRALYSTCDTMASKCAPPTTTTTGCANDDDCTTMAVADFPADVCTANECKCITASGACYRKCARDIDCAAGLICDTAQNLCVNQPGCSNDTQCAVLRQDVAAKCVSGTCTQPCSTDYDCGGSGGVFGNTVTGSVCSNGVCTISQCQDNNSCGGAGVNGDRRQFCIDVPAAMTTATVHSAITSGATM